MRGIINDREQERLQREAVAFARTKANTNTAWERPVRPVTLGEWQQREKEAA